MIPRRLARLFLVLAVVGAAALVYEFYRTATPGFDRNDPSSVLRAIRDALGREVNPADICLAVPPHFPDLVVVRFIVPDAGCLVQGLFVRGRWQRGDRAALDRLGRDMLAARGWAAASPETRRTMAREWVVEVLYPDRVVTDAARLPPVLQSANLPPPEARSRDDGGVEVRISVINLTVAGPMPARITTIIGPDGTAGR